MIDIAVEAILLSLRTLYQDFTTVGTVAGSIRRLLVRGLSPWRILDWYTIFYILSFSILKAIA